MNVKKGTGATEVDIWGDPIESEFDREGRYLREYLQKPRWNSHDAKYIIIGIAPDQSLNLEQCIVSWLPGVRQSWRNDRRIGGDLLQLSREVQAELDEVVGFISGGSVPPREWLRRSRDARYEPCWLPHLTSQETINLDVGTVKQNNSAQSAGGIATRDAGPQQAAKVNIVERWDNEFLNYNHCSERFRKFKQEMICLYCKGKPALVSERSVSSWISHLRRVHEGKSKAAEWLTEIRKKIRAASGPLAEV